MDISHNKYDCIVLDLDGTLIFASGKQKGIAQNISFEDTYGNNITLWIHKRPGFDESGSMVYGTT